jgi:uridine phosphorylase
MAVNYVMCHKDRLDEIELLRSCTDERSITQSKRFIAHRNRKSKTEPVDYPADWLFGFFPSLYPVLRQGFHAAEIRHLNPMHPISIFSREGRRFAFVFPGFGAPLAGLTLDEAVALGAERILFFGKAGSLDPETPRNGWVIPTSAVRDEGTSFHYSPPERYSYPDAELTGLLESTFTTLSVPFRKGPVWTTDAPFRETPSQIARLKNEGCIAVDMEASALFAIGRHFGKRVAGFLVTHDTVTESAWTPGDWVGDAATKPLNCLKAAVEALSLIGQTR